MSSVCLCIASMPVIYWLHPYKMFHYTGQKRTHLLGFQCIIYLIWKPLGNLAITASSGFFFSLFDEVIISGMTSVTLGYVIQKQFKRFSAKTWCTKTQYEDVCPWVKPLYLSEGWASSWFGSPLISCSDLSLGAIWREFTKIILLCKQVDF